MKLKSLKKKGFTLIELMIVVAIIGILAAVAIPKFADLVTRSRESSVKGNVATVRSAITIYYSQTAGDFPDDLFVDLTNGNEFLNPVGGVESLGRFSIPAHTQGTGNVGHTAGLYENASTAGAVTTTAALVGTSFDDLTPLIYANGGARDGEVRVNCTHVDVNNAAWSGF